MNLQGIDKIYVIHAKNGYEDRAKRITEILNKFDLKFDFFQEGDLSIIDQGMKDKYFSSGIQRDLSPGYLSCTLNHILCYEDILKNDYNKVMIFEDDLIFFNDFLEKLNKIILDSNNVDDNYIISLENSTLKFPSIWETRIGKNIYKAKYGRCTGAYIIDHTAAFNITEFLKQEKCDNIIDLWHNSLVKKDLINIYWAHPPLIEQGSHNGLYGKDKGLKRRFKWKIQKFYKWYFYRLFKRTL